MPENPFKRPSAGSVLAESVASSLAKFLSLDTSSEELVPSSDEVVPEAEVIPSDSPKGRRINDLSLELRKFDSPPGIRRCGRCSNSDPSLRDLELKVGSDFLLCEPCADYADQEIKNIFS